MMIGVAAAALASSSTMAVAADSKPSDKPAEGAAGPATMSEVVVTAQKRSERLLDVPMSVAAVSGAQLTNTGAKSMDDLRQVTPGLLTVNNGFAFLPQIRGIQSSGTSPGDATNVALYFDDVSAGAPIAGLFDLADIDHIEVLKGPQGTLFGRNATGGAIRVLTKTPSFTPEGSLSADYGFHYDEVHLTGYASGPITDTLAASFSGSFRKGDGYIKGIGPDVGRTYGGPDNYVVRGKLLYKPTADFKAILAVDDWSQQNNETFTAGYTGPINPYPGSIFSGPGTYAGGTQPIINLRGQDVSLDMTWDPSTLITVRSITGYRHWRIDAQNDADLTNLPLFYVQIGQFENAFSQEIDLSGALGHTLTWVAGGYVYDASSGNPYFRIGLGDAPTGTVFSDFNNHVHDDAYAGFGDLTWNVTNQLHLTGGIRYSTETKDFHYQQVVGTPTTTDTQHTWPSTTYRGVIRYDITDYANVYGSVSTGFKSGVYNAYSPVGNPVSPEKVTAYEIGAKARVQGVTLTAAGYAYQYDDIQVSAYTRIDGVLVVTLTNAATAKMRGLEFTADGRIFEGLYFNAGVSWEPVSKYVNYKTAQVVEPIPGATGPVVAQIVVPYDASGSKTVRTPDVTANMRLHYQKDLFGGQFNGDLNGAYTSAFYWQPGDFSREAPSFILNTRFGWTDTGRRITYSVFTTNLTDERYHLDQVPQELGSDTAEVAPGREVGAGISVSF
jgi:iron complex outermembrane receptor protein